jgi:hypothetical protein
LPSFRFQGEFFSIRSCVQVSTSLAVPNDRVWNQKNNNQEQMMLLFPCSQAPKSRIEAVLQVQKAMATLHQEAPASCQRCHGRLLVVCSSLHDCSTSDKV